jgi:anti-anti-sigma regulatory factor
MSAPALFHVESQHNVLVISPLMDMGEFNCDQIKVEGTALLVQVDAAAEKDVIIDFARSDYFGSDALGLFVHLWKKTNQRGGRIAFCGASDFGGEILQRAKFDHLGPICANRSEAFEALGRQ